MDDIFVFPLQISPKIIQHISSAMYRSPASAIKELLINSFDADATDVELKLLFDTNGQGKSILSEIQVIDNGEGMDGNKLRKVFTEIGDSLKSRETSDPNSDILTEHLKRPIVGRLGIGILAIASATSEFKVETKKKDFNQAFIAEVQIKQFDKNLEKIAAIEEFPMGKVKISPIESSDKSTGYTKVIINKFKPPFMTLINHKVNGSFFFSKPFQGGIGVRKDEEEYFKLFLNKFYENDRISNLTELDRTIVQIGNIIPVPYLSDGPVRSSFTFDGETYEIPNATGEVVMSIKRDLEEYNFNVKVTIEDPSNDFRNSFRLFKPQRFPTDNDLRDWKDKGLTISQQKPNILGFSQVADIGENGKPHPIEIKGYLYHQNTRINPREYRGLLYRVYNVAIGEEYKDDLRIYSNNPIALHQISIEIYLNKGFQSVVNIDRENFYEAGDSYQYLKAYLEHTLSGKGNLTEEAERATLPNPQFYAPPEGITGTSKPAVEPHPPIYDKIAADFGKENPNPLLSAVKDDMSSGLEEKRRIKAKKMALDPTSEFLRKSKIAQKSRVKIISKSSSAKLTLKNGEAIFSLPKVSGYHKDLAQLIIKLMLVASLKGNSSTIDSKFLKLLYEILET